MIPPLVYDFKVILIVLVAMEGLIGILIYIYDHVFNKKLIKNEDKILPVQRMEHTKKQNKIEELRETCQKSFRLGYGIYSTRLKIIKFFSIYITHFLIKTPITPNQVTFFMILLGFLSSALFSLGNYWVSLIAVLILPFYLILDAVDGEVARYKKIHSPSGDFLDGISHMILAPAIYAGITLGVFKATNNFLFLVFGMSLVLFSVFITTIQPVKNSKFLYKLMNYAKKQNFHEIPKKQFKEVVTGKTSKSLFKKIYPFLRFAFIEYLIAIVAIFNSLHLILIFFGILYPILWILFLTNEIKVGTSHLEDLIDPYRPED